MKHRKLYIIVVMLLGMYSLRAQTVLWPGDIAFSGVNTDGNQDQFAFVVLEPLAAGTVVNFTDNGWNHGTGFNSTDTESHIVWTTTSAVAAGTVVVITTYNGTAVPTASTGTVAGDKMLLSIAGDQILAYQGSKAAPQFIAAIDFNQNSIAQPTSDFDGVSNSNATTALPDELSTGLSAVHIYAPTTFAEQDNSRYAGALTSGTKLSLMKALNQRSNWEMDDQTVYTLSPFPKSFSVIASSLSAAPGSVSLGMVAGSSEVVVTSNTLWKASSNAEWLTLSAASGSENSNLTLTATGNATGKSRSAIVTLTASGLSPVSISVTQNGAPLTDVEGQELPAVFVGPNPVRDYLRVRMADESGVLTMTDLSGRVVLSSRVSRSSTVDVQSLAPGIYVVHLKGVMLRLIKE